MTGIGTLNESALHAAIKSFVARPGDVFELPVAGFVVDIVRGETLIEIQTANFGQLGRKLDSLLDERDVTVVHPIAARTIIHRPDRPARRSPARRTLHNVCDELVRMPTLIDHPRLTLRALLIEEIQMREPDPTLRRRRGGWRIVGRSLGAVLDDQLLASATDLDALLPTDLPDRFTTADIARIAGIRRPVAQRVAYCLRMTDRIVSDGRGREGVRYRRAP